MYDQTPAIRPARRAEIEQLRAIEDRAALIFEEQDLPILLELDATSVETWQSTIAAGTAWVVADTNDQPVAFALCQKTPDALHLQELDVDPSVARRGLGARLIEFVAKQARAMGRPRVTLTTYRDVPWNAPYYQRLGFHILAPEDYSDHLRQCRRAEVDMGLDVRPRVAMELRLPGSSCA